MKEDNKLSLWKHKKTGNIYVVIYSQAIECTNGREDIDYTVYTRIEDVKDMNGKIFVRQTNEFYQKFEKIRILPQGVIMAEKQKAEEIANRRCSEIGCFGHCNFSSPKHHRCGEWHREYNCAKEGIEYGYNKAKEDADKMKSKFLELCDLKDMRIAELEKANEWHYVKDGNPNNEIDILCQISKDEVVVGYYHTVAKRYFTIDGQDIYNVIAWKEIVLPKE